MILQKGQKESNMLETKYRNMLLTSLLIFTCLEVLSGCIRRREDMVTKITNRDEATRIAEREVRKEYSWLDKENIQLVAGSFDILKLQSHLAIRVSTTNMRPPRNWTVIVGIEGDAIIFESENLEKFSQLIKKEEIQVDTVSDARYIVDLYFSLTPEQLQVVSSEEDIVVVPRPLRSQVLNQITKHSVQLHPPQITSIEDGWRLSLFTWKRSGFLEKWLFHLSFTRDIQAQKELILDVTKYLGYE